MGGNADEAVSSRRSKAARSPKETAASMGCSENTVRDQLARHGLLDIGGAPKSLARDYARAGSITAGGNGS